MLPKSYDAYIGDGFGVDDDCDDNSVLFSPVQYSSAQSSSAKFSPVQPGSVQSSSVQFSSVLINILNQRQMANNRNSTTY